MPDPTQDFLGVAWRFLPRLDARGQIELVPQDQAVEQAIRLILLTRKGERVMRPEFGSELHRLVFAPSDASTAGLACRYVEEALTRWEPRIDVLDVDAEPDRTDPSRLMIRIRYRLIRLNSERNLVFPFYVIPGED
jgi:phage baseplate assembly protein W